MLVFLLAALHSARLTFAEASLVLVQKSAYVSISVIYGCLRIRCRGRRAVSVVKLVNIFLRAGAEVDNSTALMYVLFHMHAS